MANIHSIGKAPGLATQSPEAQQQLGTEGFDFMNALLGLQAASQTPEWWQTDPDAPQNFAALNFGQDAALPMVADPAINAMALPMPTAPTVGSQNIPTLDVKTAPENAVQSLVDFSQVSEPLSDGKQGVLTGLDVKALLQIPMEELQPKQVQQILSSVWGDVKEVKVEDAPESPHADPTQHSLMKLMAKNVETGNQTAASAPKVLAEKVSAKPDMPIKQEATSQALPEAAPKIREEKKAETPFLASTQGERVQDSSTSFEVAAKPEGGQVATTPKLMPQVLPKLEDLVQQGGGKLTMLLDPPELGKLTIELTTRGKNVEVSIHSDNQQTRTALEGGMADLQQALQSQDLNLTSAEVHVARESSFASMNFGQGPNQHGQSSSREGSGSFSRSREERLWSRDLLAEAPVTRNRVAGRLDVRV
jgi:hypothetical protein